MTVTATVNQSWTDPDTEFPGVFLDFLDALIAAGWRVLGSGDGLSAFENQGQTSGSGGTGPGGGFDVITHGGTGANGFNNSSFATQKASWRRMRTPTAASVQIEFIVWANWQANPGTDQNYWRIECGAPGVVFDSGGSSGAPPVPDGAYFCVGGRQARTVGGSADDRAALAPGAAGRADWWIGDADDDYDFMFQTRRNGIGGTFHCFGVFARLALYAPWPGPVAGVEDPDPFVWIGILPNVDSATGGSWINAGAVHRVQNNPTTPTRLEDRTTIQNREGVIASYGLGTGDPDEGHYFVSFSFWGESTGGGYMPGLTGDAIGEGLGADPITGETIVAYNYAVSRGRDLVSSQAPLFYKGTVKTRTILGSPSRFENPPVIEDSDRSKPRRIAWGFASLLWVNGAAIDGIDAATTTARRYVEVEPAAGPPPDPGPDPDTTPPVVSNVTPAPGSQISKFQSIGFDVTEESGNFTRILVAVWYKTTGVQELVHDGDTFVGHYSAASVRNPITNGFHYDLARSGGWPDTSIQIRIFPIDAAGNET